MFETLIRRGGGSVVCAKVALSGASNRCSPLPWTLMDAGGLRPVSKLIFPVWVSGFLGANVTAKVFDFPLESSNSGEPVIDQGSAIVN